MQKERSFLFNRRIGYHWQNTISPTSSSNYSQPKLNKEQNKIKNLNHHNLFIDMYILPSTYYKLHQLNHKPHSLSKSFSRWPFNRMWSNEGSGHGKDDNQKWTPYCLDDPQTNPSIWRKKPCKIFPIKKWNCF